MAVVPLAFDIEVLVPGGPLVGCITGYAIANPTTGKNFAPSDTIPCTGNSLTANEGDLKVRVNHGAAPNARASEIPITADASCDWECTFPVPGGLWSVGAANVELFAGTALKVSRNIKIYDPNP